MDAGGGSCVTSYLQCGGRLGTHTGWSEILRTCPRAVCAGVHPSLLGHRSWGLLVDSRGWIKTWSRASRPS